MRNGLSRSTASLQKCRKTIRLNFSYTTENWLDSFPIPVYMLCMPTTPYTTSPNPALLYLTPSLKSTLAKVRFVLDYRQGLTAVLGDPGMGKSTLVRLLHLEYSLRDDC